MNRPSPIEAKFEDACHKAGIVFEEQLNVSRYRVDFIDRSRKLVIELDGHEDHKTVEDRTYDASRDRKLQREGFTVLRFTGTEITRNVNLCVQEVQQTIRLMQPQPMPQGAIYIDWLFLQRSFVQTHHDLEELNPNASLEKVTLTRLLDLLAGYLHLEGRFDVHLFSVSFSDSMVEIDTLKIYETGKAQFHITEHLAEFVAIGLTEHLHQQGTSYETIVLVADDAMYPPALDKGRAIDYLIRKDNDTSSMLDLRPTTGWQDLYYVLGHCMGLHASQM